MSSRTLKTIKSFIEAKPEQINDSLDKRLTKDTTFADRYKVINELGRGSFGTIYKGIDIKRSTLVAIKVEKEDKKSSQAQLKSEAKVYKEMEGAEIANGVRWPRVHLYTKDDQGNGVMVMDLLGPNLDTLLEKAPGKKFSPPTIAYLANKMLILLERFHGNGFVHRDLKPQNFVIEFPTDNKYPKYPEVFLIDLGLAKRYVSTKDERQHAPFVQQQGLKGTVRYLSINTHLGIEQSRRDDLQSVGYILAYMALGQLPWQNMMKKEMDKKDAHHMIMMKKISTTAETLTNDIEGKLKDAILAYMLYTSSLMYHETPNYHYCQNLFKPILKDFDGDIYNRTFTRKVRPKTSH